MGFIQDRIKRIKSNPDNPLPESAIIGLRGSTKSIVEDREIVFVATTDDVDEHNEVVVAGGSMPGSYFERNRSVMVDHYHETAYLVGKARWPWEKMYHAFDKRHCGWKVRVRMLDNPMGNDLLRVAQEHGIGCSIGFNAYNIRPADDSDKKMYGDRVKSVIDRWSWVELSITAMPANASCQSVGSGSQPKGLAEQPEGLTKAICNLDELCTKGIIRPETAYALGMPREGLAKKKTIIFV